VTNERFLRIKEVQNRVGLKRSQIYLLIQQQKFPSQIKLSKRSCAWLESEINQWIQNLIKKSRKNTGVKK
jgi:prophage regulatory protein